jgi:hypothetical protein
MQPGAIGVAVAVEPAFGGGVGIVLAQEARRRSMLER